VGHIWRGDLQQVLFVARRRGCVRPEMDRLLEEILNGGRSRGGREMGEVRGLNSTSVDER